jgi:hypothetical protein
MSEITSTQEQQPSPEYLAGVLSVTREQLTRAMGVCAELEALVNIERSKNQQYEAKIADLQDKLANAIESSEDKK